MQSARGRTLIVMPAFNEEDSVSRVIGEVRSKLPDVDILVVDDGSSDETTWVARRAGARVATLPFNLGVGGAMRTGFRYALERGYRNVVQIDADGQHDPSDVPLLLAALDRSDLVLGARFAGTGDYRVTGPRRWAMALLGRALSRSAGVRLTDTTSGFRASGPRTLRLFAEHYPAEYLGDTIEALVIATRAGHTVSQVPVSMRARYGGRPSHRPVKAAAYLARALLALVFAFLRPAATIQLNSSELR
jgi:glycosyltransferase involved in cell wall biosynthesis